MGEVENIEWHRTDRELPRTAKDSPYDLHGDALVIGAWKDGRVSGCIYREYDIDEYGERLGDPCWLQDGCCQMEVSAPRFWAYMPKHPSRQ